MKITNEQYHIRTGLILFEASDEAGVFCCSIQPKELDQQERTLLALNSTQVLSQFNEKREQIEKAASTAMSAARQGGIKHRRGKKNTPLEVILLAV